MNRPVQPASIHPREVGLAFVAAALLLLAIAMLLNWLEGLRPPLPPPPPEDFVTEYRLEDPEDRPEPPPEDTSTLVEPAEVEQQVTAPTQDQASPSKENAETLPAPPPKEEPPMELVVLPPDELRRQSVDQPTTNAEVPETDNYFLAEVDNRADEQTIAENATTEFQDSAPVDQRAQDSESTTATAIPSPTRDQQPTAAQEPTQSSENERDDVKDTPAKGNPDATAQELKELEARQREEHDRQAQTVGDRLEQSSTTPFDTAADGRVKVQPDAQTAESFGRASGLGAQMQRATERSQQNGRGRDSVTRQGAAYADANFEEMFGDRRQEYQERSEQSARRESLLGDHAGDWQRTREAMENYDVAVTTGSETMLNTRRDDHARFINAYHAKIHDPWWKVLELLDRRYGPGESISNRDLTVRVEVRVLGDGKIDRVRIVSTSGSTFFDAEAIRVNYDVRRTPAPQANILCEDGSVYLHWTYSRAPGRCGTHGASVHCPRSN